MENLLLIMERKKHAFDSVLFILKIEHFYVLKWRYLKHLCISNNKMLNAFQIEKQVKKVEGTYLEGDEHFYGVKRNFKDRYICINCINIKYVCKRFQDFL